jgi:hypothetical protein
VAAGGAKSGKRKRKQWRSGISAGVAAGKQRTRQNGVGAKQNGATKAIMAA